MRLKDIPIQRKLMSVILITSALVLSLMCVAYIILEYYSFRETLKRDITVLGDVISSNVSGAVAFQSHSDANEILNALRAEPHVVAACIYDSQGKIFAYYPADISPEVFPEDPGKDGYHFMRNHLEGFKTIRQKDKQLGILYIKSDLEAMYDQLQKYILIGLLLISSSMLVAVAISKILQKSISEPILALEQKAKAVSEKRDYSVRAKKFSNDEVGALTEAFNIMLTEIQSQNQEITLLNQSLEKKVIERTAALQEQKDFVETIINSSIDLIAVFDREMNYIMLNKRTDDFYPLQRSEMIGKNLLDIFPQLQNSQMVRDFNLALEGEIVYNKNYHSAITGRTFENYYIPLKNHDNEVYGILVIGHDITNLTETKEKLELINAELVKSNRDLEQFAYIASHDLQEPLRKIQTFSQLMQEYFHDPEQLKYYHQKIKQAASRMQQLIKDVLNFSRISNSEEAFVKTDLNVILENLKTDFELILRDKNAEIISETLPVIDGIPLQLTQLFSNLISNSLKYNQNKPKIIIKSTLLKQEQLNQFPQLQDDPCYVRLEFQDNGIGFEQEFSEQIFNIFQRLHGKNTYSGTGIGLALCKKIVENHNGVIYAQSNPGEGSVFTIFLPAGDLCFSQS
jgi:PAS domain S-box-containing protein